MPSNTPPNKDRIQHFGSTSERINFWLPYFCVFGGFLMRRIKRQSTKVFILMHHQAFIFIKCPFFLSRSWVTASWSGSSLRLTDGVSGLEDKQPRKHWRGLQLPECLGEAGIPQRNRKGRVIWPVTLINNWNGMFFFCFLFFVFLSVTIEFL